MKFKDMCFYSESVEWTDGAAYWKCCKVKTAVHTTKKGKLAFVVYLSHVLSLVQLHPLTAVIIL